MTGTPTSRLDLIRSVLLDNTVCIDRYHENTLDKALFDGHYYSDKAPGVVVLALPAAVIAFAVLVLCDVPLESDAAWLALSWIATSLSIGVITAIGGSVMFRWLCRYTPPRHALITTYAVFLGTSAFPYATMLHSHALVITLIVSVLSLLTRSVQYRHVSARMLLRHGLAGMLAGAAIASEYSSAAIVLLILVALVQRQLRPIICCGVGALSGMVVIPLYNVACFDALFTLSYLHEAVFVAHNTGLCGITMPPSSLNAWILLFSPSRGLFWWTPLFFLALRGYGGLFEGNRRMFLLCYAGPVLQVLAFAGYWDVYGGLSIGPRYLAPIVPLLALPTALGLCNRMGLGCTLAAWSIAVGVIATAVNAQMSGSIMNPLCEYYLPMLFRYGEATFNLGVILGADVTTSVVLFGIVVGGGIIASWRLTRWSIQTQDS